MQYHFSAAALLALAARQAAAQSAPTVTTPTSLVECQPAQFTVSGGTAPYFISILPGGQAGATPLQSLPQVSAAGSVTWDVNIPANTPITIEVRDSTGALNYSQQVTVQAGTCVSSASSAAPTTPTPGAAAGVSSVASSAASSAPTSSVGAATGSSVSPNASSGVAAAHTSASSVASASSAASASSVAPAASTSASKSSAASGLQASGLLTGVAALFAALFV